MTSLSFLPDSASGCSNAGATVTQLIVAATFPEASIGASAPGSALSRSTLAASTPFDLSKSGQTTFDDEKVAVAMVLPATSLMLEIPDVSVVNSASGWIV